MSLVSGAPATMRGSLCTGYSELQTVFGLSNDAGSTIFWPVPEKHASVASAGLFLTTFSGVSGDGSLVSASSHLVIVSSARVDSTKPGTGTRGSGPTQMTSL